MSVATRQQGRLSEGKDAEWWGDKARSHTTPSRHAEVTGAVLNTFIYMVIDLPDFYHLLDDVARAPSGYGASETGIQISK